MSVFLSEYVGDQQRSAKVYYDEENEAYVGEFYVDGNLINTVRSKTDDIKYIERLADDFVKSTAYQSGNDPLQYLTEDGAN